VLLGPILEWALAAELQQEERRLPERDELERRGAERHWMRTLKEPEQGELPVREEWYNAILQSKVLENYWEGASLSMLTSPKMTKMTMAIQLHLFGLAKSPEPIPKIEFHRGKRKNPRSLQVDPFRYERAVPSSSTH
jgi:hypothetical protein